MSGLMSGSSSWRDGRRAIYTRYGDDLAFSWASEHMLTGFARTNEETLSSAGYEVQPAQGLACEFHA